MELAYSGTSPFVYRDGLAFVTDSDGNVTEKYIRSCISTGQINGSDYELLYKVYEYGLLNMHLITRLFPSRSVQSCKRCVSKLVRTGFLNRYHCSYDQGLGSSTLFYGVSSGTGRFFSNSGMKGRLYSPTPSGALERLVLNQFEISMQEFDRKLPFISDCRHTMLHVNRKDIDLGYSVLLSTDKSPLDVRLFPVPVRRDDAWEKQARDHVRMAFAYQHAGEISFPLCICEDIVHMRQLRRSFADDSVLCMSSVLYCTDIDVSGPSTLSRLSVFSHNGSDGAPVFMNAELV